MAISRKPKPAASETAAVDVDALIHKGGSVAGEGVVSVKVVEIAGGLEVAIDQAAWGGTSDGGLGVASPSINGGSSSAMASTCM
jgi:hypothetical protein